MPPLCWLAATWLGADRDADVVGLLEQTVALGGGSPDVALTLAAAYEALGWEDAAGMTLRPMEGQPGQLASYVRSFVQSLMTRRRVAAARKVLRVAEKRAGHGADRKQIAEMARQMRRYGGATR